MRSSGCPGPCPDAPHTLTRVTEHAVGPVARRLFVATVLVQCGIVVTGALVRLTGSGLGCPTWPECVSGSLVPTAGQPQGVHKTIEFANRSLTLLVLAVVVAGVVVAWRESPRRRPLVLLAAGGLVGVFGQAVLGGMTVLTGLNPSLVAAHLLLSMLLIAVAVALQQRGQDPGDGALTLLARPELRWLSWCLVGLGALVLVLGTVVTGSGPHGGDEKTPRYGFDIAHVAQLHADAVILFIALTVGTWLALRLTDAPAAAQRRVVVLFVVSMAQGLIGYVQYSTGVPWVLVAFHLVGACAVWVCVLRVPYALRERAPREVVDVAQKGSSGSSATARNTTVR
jgi:heme a synthase